MFLACIAVNLLKFSPVSQYGGMPLEGHTLAVVFYQSFEKHSRDTNYKDNGNGWLMRRKTKKG